MICPNCNAEYRPGFSHRVDCDVDLVEAAPGALVAQRDDSSAVETEDPFCEFWKGEDARVRGELCDILSEENIPIRTLEWQDHLFNRTRLPVLRIAVPFSMFERAEKAVVEAYGSAETAGNVMNPAEENRPGFRKLLELTLGEKFRKEHWHRDRNPRDPHNQDKEESE